MEILSGLASMQLEAHGWTNEVRGALRPEHLELLGPEAVRITLPPSAAYNLVLAETVAVQANPKPNPYPNPKPNPNPNPNPNPTLTLTLTPNTVLTLTRSPRRPSSRGGRSTPRRASSWRR